MSISTRVDRTSASPVDASTTLMKISPGCEITRVDFCVHPSGAVETSAVTGRKSETPNART